MEPNLIGGEICPKTELNPLLQLGTREYLKLSGVRTKCSDSKSIFILSIYNGSMLVLA